MKSWTKRIFLLFLSAFTILEAKPSSNMNLFFASGIKSSKDALFELRQGLERIVSGLEPSVQVGMEIISLDRGQKIYEKNPHRLLTPAGVHQLYTAAAALALLGVDFRFETTLLADGVIEHGVLKGNLYIRGAGNPEFSIRDLEELAFQLKLLQIEKIEGHLIIDNFAFDGIAKAPGWVDEKPSFINAPMDALVINHSCVDLWIKPVKMNEPPQVFYFPVTSYISIQNKALTLNEPKKPLDVICKSNNQVCITGEIAYDHLLNELKVPLQEPHLYLGNLMMELLPKYGISIAGKLRHQPTPAEVYSLSSHFSSPLSLLVWKMLKTSDHLYSDCLFKKIGQINSEKTGSWKTGTLAVKQFLEEKAAILPSEISIMDGSGESRYNLSSAHQLVNVLALMYQKKECFAEFFTALPIGGVDTPLQDRFKDSKAKGLIRAHAGSMPGVSSLAGYVSSKGGELFAFSIIFNGLTHPPDDYRSRIEDEVCLLLADFSRYKD